MQTAGYSGKPPAAKLGIKPGGKVFLINPANGYHALVGPLPPGAAFSQSPEDADLIHAFVAHRADLMGRSEALTDGPRVGAALWISWPKKSSKLFVDLTEDGVREIILPSGWVDAKVCAVDEDWSALKFLRRRSNRGAR